jgi:hypothetical protein
VAENISPCGSPNCLAVAMEDLLTNQTETLNRNLTSLLAAKIDSMKEILDRCDSTMQKNVVRLEEKHDKETSELFTRLGNLEGTVQVIKDRQVGTPRCEREMTETDGRIDLLESCIFTQEQKDKLINGSLTKEERDNVVQIITDAKQAKSFRQSIKVGILILIIMGIIKFGLDIYYHIESSQTMKQHIQIEQKTSGKVGVNENE